MSEEIKEAVRRQFGANAASYSVSGIHAKGSDLSLLPALAELTGVEQVLDVATATGHTALALAPYAAHVTGVDLTPEMLSEARRLAAEQGVTNVAFAVGDAERLPFPDGAFDVVTCRIAAHHFPDLPAFCREAARVLKPGGRLLVVDNVAPDSAELDRFINELEKLRDPSHFREHRLSEWDGYLTSAGLDYSLAHTFDSLVDTESWLKRMQVPESTAAEIRLRLAQAPAPIREAFAITETSFHLHKAVLIGRKRA